MGTTVPIMKDMELFHAEKVSPTQDLLHSLKVQRKKDLRDVGKAIANRLESFQRSISECRLSSADFSG